jgi:hypothetical protein
VVLVERRSVGTEKPEVLHPDAGDLHADVEHLTHRLHVRVVAPQDFVPAGEHRVGHVLQAVHREGAVVQELELGPGAAQRGYKYKRTDTLHVGKPLND